MADEEIKAGIEAAAQETQALIAQYEQTQGDRGRETDRYASHDWTGLARARVASRWTALKRRGWGVQAAHAESDRCYHASTVVLLLRCRSNYLKALQVAVGAPTGAKDQSSRDLAATSVANVINVSAQQTDRQGEGSGARPTDAGPPT